MSSLKLLKPLPNQRLTSLTFQISIGNKPTFRRTLPVLLNVSHACLTQSCRPSFNHFLLVPREAGVDRKKSIDWNCAIFRLSGYSEVLILHPKPAAHVV